MKQTSSAYAKYWCKSLDDAHLAQGGLERSDLLSWSILSKQGLQYGQVGAILLQQYFLDHPSNQSTIDVVIRPFVFGISAARKKQDGINLPKIISPIITLAQLRRNGRITPIRSFFARDLLEPVSGKRYAIGKLRNLDDFLKTSNHTSIPTFFTHEKYNTPNAHSTNIQWHQYIEACEQALKSVCENWPEQTNAYKKMGHGYICKHADLSVQLSKNEPVQALYRHLAKYDDAQSLLNLSLFESYTREYTQLKHPCLPLHANFSKRLTSSSKQIAYTASQLNALAHILEVQDGEMLAVNCPAGTGKTTLLKAAVTTQWAQAALQKAPPPISIAVSNNINSLQNIVDAFGKNLLSADNPFEGRWLPGLGQTRRRRRPAKQAQLPSFDLAESCDELFETLESPAYFEKAKESYLITAQLNLPQIKIDNVVSVVDFLYEKLQTEADRLSQLESVWHSISNTEQKVTSLFGNDSSAAIEEAEQNLKQATIEMHAFTDFTSLWKNHQEQAPKVFSSFLTLLPSYINKQLKEAQEFLQLSSPPGVTFEECNSIDQIQEKIDALYAERSSALTTAQTHLDELQHTSNTEKILSIDWVEAVIDLLAESGLEHVQNITDADAAADKSIRFNIFQLATHYWEGQWLLEMERRLLQPTSFEYASDPAQAALSKWRHRMMIFPCMATTCDALPELFQIQNTQTQEPTYLFNSIDWLLVDQAGQLSPDIAGASFTLAKKALVMGDTLQALPIPPLNRYADAANLEHTLLAPHKRIEQEFLKLTNLGKTASLGNVMRIAQTASKYHQEHNLAAGMFLTEQFSSYSEIIEYGNKLCYQGKLTSMRGHKALTTATYVKAGIDALPAMGYVHVDGLCLQNESGSYHNLNEAQAIANWLGQKRAALEKRYRKPLEQIVAIATPYAGQTDTIVQTCQDKDIDASGYNEPGKLIVGTARTLQGSGRPIVIFSNVHCKHLTYIPVRRDANLLNVATSHACDTFLLFSDMDVLANALPTTPRGILAQILLSRDSNQIDLEPQLRTDLINTTDALIAKTPTTAQWLQTPQEHDAYFEQLLTGKGQNIIIAYPALELCKLENSKALKSITTAIERGANVSIYTDIPSSTLTSRPESITIDQPARISLSLHNTMQMLKSLNISVHLVSKIHNRALICDHNTYCISSYPWLNPTYKPARGNFQESLAYFGPGVTQEIETQKRNLHSKIITVYYPPLGTI